GAPNSNVVNMARRGLRLELRAAIHKAIKTRQEVVHRNVVVESNGGTTTIDLIVRPLAETGPRSSLPAGILPGPLPRPPPPGPPPKGSPRRTHRAQALADDDRILRQLESELQATKDRLQTTVEELETSNEELKSSNEELLSMNEELQSANEEMQTSKEELQSL